MASLLQGKTVFVAGMASPVIGRLIARLSEEGAAVRLPPEDRRAADALASDCSAGLDGIDILVNLIPGTPVSAFFDMSQPDWELMLSTAFSDAFRWSQAVGRAMSLSGKRGAIINIVYEPDDAQGALAVFAPMIRRGSTVAFTQALAAELADRQIQVNAVVSRAGERGGSAPNHAAEDVIRATLFLCAADATSVTGETIYVGGATQAYEKARFPA